MNRQRHPWERPLLPQFMSYGLVIAAYMAFTLVLLYILLDSQA